MTDDEDVLIKITDAKNPEALSDIDSWLAFRTPEKLEVITSNHQLLRSQASALHDQRFFDMFGLADI